MMRRLNPFDAIAFIRLAVAAALVVVMLTSCGRQTPDQRAQHLANADAGQQAAGYTLAQLRSTLSAAGMLAEVAQVDRAAAFLRGARDFVGAANDGKPLPPPSVATDDPETYGKEAAKAKKDASGWGMAGM